MFDQNKRSCVNDAECVDLYTDLVGCERVQPLGLQLMPGNRLHVDGARVLADLNTLRGIGAYKTGVHKPTFSEPHMRSLQWLAQRLPEAGLAARIDGTGNVLGPSTKTGPNTFARWHS